MTAHKLLIASDLHYCHNLAAETAANCDRLPPDTYDHRVDGRLFWHNEMLVEEMDGMLDALLALTAREEPDLVVFLGDLVNTNWRENVAHVGRRLAEFPCPVEVVTGNHDIYLADPAGRVQDFTAPGAYQTGCRHQQVGDFGLLFIDLFVRYEDGAYAKWLDVTGAAGDVGYRPQDVEAALQHLADHAEVPHLLLGHFPMCTPEERLRQPGRRIGWSWPDGRPLAERLAAPGNLAGIVAGHQHFAHFQAFAGGFHWTVPPLVEYPCAAAILELAPGHVSGRLVQPRPALAQKSLAVRGEVWPFGAPADREFAWAIERPH